MMKKEYLERKEYEIECIAPVHIGNGEALKAYEYLYDRQAQEVYFINEAQWIRLLAKHDLMDAFSRYIEETARAMGRSQTFRGDYLWEWLCKRGVEERELYSLAATKAPVATNNPIITKGSLNDIARTMVLADGRPYIPGSSIKGALRTAILHHFICAEPKKYGHIWRDMSRADWENRKIDKDMQHMSRRLEQSVFSKLDIPEAKNDAVKSVMRGLLISDALCTEGQQETVILQKVDGSTKANRMNNTEHTVPVFRECIPTGTKLRFSITLDRRMMEAIGISSIDEIVSMERDFTQFVLGQLKPVFGPDYEAEFKEAEEADIFLGGGTGFQSKTLFYSLAPSEREGRPLLATYLDNKFTVYDRKAHRKVPAHNHRQEDRRISPRTLKLTRTRTDRCLMGLCCMSEV